MKLYSYWRSSASYRVRIALNLKGIDYELVPVDLRPPASAHQAPEFLELNPEGRVPVLVSGERVLTQSLAIIEYLEERQPLPALLPRSAPERAQVRALALAVACDISPLNNSGVLNYLRSPLGHDDDAVLEWYHHWVARGLTALEEQVRRLGGDGRFTFGSSVTLADVVLVPQMYNARRYQCDLEPYPALRSISAHLEKLPAFARAAPEAQPDAV